MFHPVFLPSDNAPALAVLQSFAFVRRPPTVNLPEAQTSHHYKYQDYDAAVQIVSFYARPNFKHLCRMFAEISNHGAAGNNGAVGILRITQFHMFRRIAEKIARIHIPGQRRVGASLQYFGGGYRTDVSVFFHIAQSNVGTAKEIDEVTCRLFVTGVPGDYPTVVPNVAAFFRHGISQVNAYCLCLLDGPLRISAPRHVQPRLSFGHHFLAEIGFPTRHLRFQQLQILFHRL